MQIRKFALLVLMAGSFASILAQSYDYDVAGRLIRVAYPQGGGIAYRFDESDNMVEALSLALPPAPAGVQLSREGASSYRLTWQPVGGASAYVVLRAVGGAGQWTEIARVPATSQSFLDTTATPGQVYSYRLAAVTSDGQSAYSAEVTTDPGSTVDPRSGRSLSLQSGAAGSLVTSGATTETFAGYAKVTVENGAAPYGLAVFQLRQNGAIVGETGVPATPPTRGSRIFIEYRDGVRASAGQYAGTVNVNTGIAFVNPGEEPAAFTLTLRNRMGAVVATGSGSMPPGRHTAKLVSEFSSIAPDFHLPSDFATASGFGTLDIESSQPLSVLALRLTINQRGELLFSTTTILDLRAPAPVGPVYFAHVPEGGGFNSKLALISTSNLPQSGVLRLVDDSGSPFRVRSTQGETGSEFSYAIAPGGVFVLETDGSVPGVSAGWAVVTPESGQSAPAGSGTFTFAQGGVLTTESGIPISLPTARARVYVDTTTGYDTGLALANPGDASLQISVRAFQLDGQTPAGTVGAPLSLGAFAHTAREGGRFVTGLPANFTGLLEVESATPFVALTVRSLVNSRGELIFTTFPVADQTRPAPSPVVFPHLADGGGFRTELILISPGSTSSATVRLFDSAGQPMNVL